MFASSVQPHGLHRAVHHRCETCLRPRQRGRRHPLLSRIRHRVTFLRRDSRVPRDRRRASRPTHVKYGPPVRAAVHPRHRLIHLLRHIYWQTSPIYSYPLTPPSLSVDPLSSAPRRQIFSETSRPAFREHNIIKLWGTR
jgi:hypothetical protein